MIEEVSEEIDNDLTPEDKAATKKAQVHRPPLNFYEMGMQKSGTLIWKYDPAVTVIIQSERTVLYNEQERSLSPLSAELTHIAATKVLTA